MQWLSLALATYVGLVSAHCEHAIPHVLGGRKILAELRSRGIAGPANHVRHAGATPATSRNDNLGLQSRQDDSRCGPGFGSCSDGLCCSDAGYCGKTKDYCRAPDCQINYGPGCDALQKPKGIDTTNISRPKLGKVQYGGLGIYDCVTKGDIALTYDDGPYLYTNDLLNIYKRYGMVATFFITGNNLGKGMINDPSTDWPAIIKRMAAEGHQVASHTWSHQNASQLTDAQYRDQMIYNEIAFGDLLGYFPTYMRPPFSICESNCQAILSELGYHIIYFDLDTEGYLHPTPDGIQIGKDIWDQRVKPANPAKKSFLQIEHDIQPQSVYNLTEYFLASVKEKGFRAVPVGVCLGDDPANWYRAVGSGTVPTVWPPAGVNLTSPSTNSSDASSTSTGSAASPSSTLQPSLDGSCGNGVTCLGSGFGDCCSQYGWCGTTTDHCNSACQPAFGNCPNSVNSTSSSIASAPTTSSAGQGSSSTGSSPSGLSPSADSNLTTSLSSLTQTTIQTTAAATVTSSGNSSGLASSTGILSGQSTSGSLISSSTQSTVPISTSSTSTSTSTPTTNSVTARITSSSTTFTSSAASVTAKSSSSSTTSKSSSSSITAKASSPSTTAKSNSSSARSSSSSSSTKATTTTSKATQATTKAVTVSTNGECGKAVGMTCEKSNFLPCCGTNNKCGLDCISCQGAYGLGFCLF